MAEKCCWLLERMSQDLSYLLPLTNWSVDLYSQTIGRRTNLSERTSTTSNHRETVKGHKKQLPDPHNIKHDGFRLVAFSSLSSEKCRSRSKPFRSRHWTTICPSFADLARDARAIPNLADRPYVMMLIGSNSYRSIKSWSSTTERGVKLSRSAKQHR